jgi:steroid delta-isomerase-like uncharacterized protein
MNATWATEWLRRCSASDPDDLMEMYVDDVRFEDAALDQTVQGKPRVREFFAALMNPAKRRNTFTLVAYCGDELGGAVEWIWKAEHHAEFMGLPARGRETTVRGVSVVTFQAGQVSTQHDYWDTRTVAQQAGHGPVAAGERER